MSEQTRISHPKEPPLSMDVEGFDSLTELALDLRLSWNHATDQLWRVALVVPGYRTPVPSERSGA